MSDIEAYPHPACMAPDGADPCEGYHALQAKLTEANQEIERLKSSVKWRKEFMDGLGKDSIAPIQAEEQQ